MRLVAHTHSIHDAVLLPAARLFMSAGTAVRHIADVHDDWIMRALTGSAALAALGCVYWAAFLHIRSGKLKTDARQAPRTTDAPPTPRNTLMARCGYSIETLDLLETLPASVAVFDVAQRLVCSNSRYAALWGFSQSWLDRHPTQGEILDRLRDSRRIPEQRDFAGWKKSQLKQFAEAARSADEYWHLPTGRSIRVIAKPHTHGGLIIAYEDVTELLRLKAENASLAAVQRATLDAIDCAVAIFQPDGRLTAANQAFAKLWQLSPQELAGGPHFSKIAALCRSRIGQDGAWDIIAAAVSSEIPERQSEQESITRADGRVISLGPSRLPDGSTLMTFHDTTDIERFDAFSAVSVHHAA